ncbi:MAG: class I SAM-dependent methyltransferase [Pyrinomonadaceae bacterium MAG19_C2-C3]|nr:class I SAM-dependent methyltransferase [Pyrinomonadaceae bacterium MAG19_C2-C3]
MQNDFIAEEQSSIGEVTPQDPVRFKEASQNTRGELLYRLELDEYFKQSAGTTAEKLQNFTKYVSRQALTQFLFRYDMFQRILTVQGSIIECGVLFGGGLMAWAQLSAILEPVNHQRRVIGFDTFAGFSKIAKEDSSGESSHLNVGDYAVDSYDDLLQAIKLYDANRFLNHVPKVELVRGDVIETVPQFLARKQHTIVSLLYLDFDLFEPTKTAIEHFVPRMPKGAIIAFDQVNSENWHGETTALLQTLGVRNVRLERCPFESVRSFAVLD